MSLSRIDGLTASITPIYNVICMHTHAYRLIYIMYSPTVQHKRGYMAGMPEESCSSLVACLR